VEGVRRRGRRRGRRLLCGVQGRGLRLGCVGDGVGPLGRVRWERCEVGCLRWRALRSVGGWIRRLLDKACFLPCLIGRKGLMQ